MQNKKPILMLVLILLPAISLLIIVAVSKGWTTNIFQAGYHKKECKPTHRAGGFVRDTVTLAEMSAITSWAKKVSKYGPDYNFWTNASRKILRCRKIHGTRLVNCMVWAAPCKTIYPEKPKIVALKSK